MNNFAFNFGSSAPAINFTQEQQDIINSTESAIIVNAVAGSGKTSVLMQLANTTSNGLYLAFNKAIVNDVVDKLPMGWSCKTFNSLGLSMLKQHSKFKSSKVNFKKYSKLFNYDVAANLAQKHMTLGGNASDKSWEATCDRFNIASNLIEDAKVFLKQGLMHTTEISGDEMLEYPMRLGMKTEKYDMVLVDECQDLNPQQIKFLNCIPTNKIVFVGDAHQAIYGFRGSDPHAIDLIKQGYNPKEYPMYESFRCPQEILSIVHSRVPHITSQKTGGVLQQKYAHSIQYPDDCFIISRTNSSLIKLAYQFIKKDIKFSIGRMFIAQLEKELKPLLKTNSRIDTLIDNTKAQYHKILQIYESKNWNTAALNDRYSGIFAILDRCNTIAEVKTFIKSMKLHEDSASKRKLMTIHASKGLETDTVFFINPDICDYLKTRTNVEWEQQQEDNLYYVACTRALQQLVLVR